MNDHVIVLHGIFRTSRSMRPVAKVLTHAGYRVHNLDYASTRYPFATLVAQVQEQVERLALHEGRLHYVGYSMGGLLVRALLSKHKPTNLGCAVQLAPPNHGSEVADKFRNIWLYKKLYGPAGQQLGKDLPETSYLFAPIDYELGVIAGNLSIDPLCSRMITGEDDGKVSVASTKLVGMKDHIVVRACHTFFPSHREVHRQMLHFITHRSFTNE